MSAIHRRAVVVALAVVASVSCSVEPASVPVPSGPSELALSLGVSASPDMISQDGVSTSRLNITARDSNGLPKSGVALRLDILVQDISGALVPADYGTLSNRWPSTGSDGTVGVTYIAPPTPNGGVVTNRVVTFRVIPIGTDYSDALSRTVDLLLVPPGTIRPPTRMVPKFTYSPSGPRTYDTVFFDASSTSDPDAAIVSYQWQFGDGSTSTLQVPTHVYKKKGDYAVSLIVTNAIGCTDRTERMVRIKEDYNLLAAPAFSPNGDGVEEHFMPEALKTLERRFRMTIHDPATGALMYETSDLKRPWNGRVNGVGAPCATGDYVWMVEMKDGEALGGTYTGTVSLLR